MAGIIVAGSVALGVAYVLLWWLRPDLRTRIEAPGQRFAAAARRYDKSCRTAPDESARDRSEGLDNTDTIR